MDHLFFGVFVLEFFIEDFRYARTMFWLFCFFFLFWIILFLGLRVGVFLVRISDTLVLQYILVVLFLLFLFWSILFFLLSDWSFGLNISDMMVIYILVNEVILVFSVWYRIILAPDKLYMKNDVCHLALPSRSVNLWRE